MSRSAAGIGKRCGCRDQRAGRQTGRRCPLLARPGHGSWYLTAELPAGPEGQRRRVRVGGYPTRAAAQAALGRLRARSGPARAGTGWTTGQWLETWLAGRSSLRPSTRHAYRQHLDCYLIPAIGQVPLAMLTAADLRDMLAGISRQRGAAGTPVSAATLTRIRATIRAALNAAIREGLIAAHPARIIDLPPVPRQHPAVWTCGRLPSATVVAIRILRAPPLDLRGQPVVSLDAACFEWTATDRHMGFVSKGGPEPIAYGEALSADFSVGALR